MERDKDDEELAALRKMMSPEQIKKMSQIVEAEVQRRENMKNNKVDSKQEQMAHMYSEIDERLKAIKSQKNVAKNDNSSFTSIFKNMKLPRISSLSRFQLNQSAKNIALISAVVIFATAKILMISSGSNENGKSAPTQDLEQTVKIEVKEEEKFENTAENKQLNNKLAQTRARLESPYSASTSGEQQLLNELDARRSELAKRAQNLDEKEAELKNQSQALAEKLAQLKSLTEKVQQVRTEKDNQYEARLEQLAQVYGSIAPNEAAPLVAKLDEETALALLKRMPSKRIGQILSQMEPQRAVELTKVLTLKDKLEDLPAK